MISEMTRGASGILELEKKFGEAMIQNDTGRDRTVISNDWINYDPMEASSTGRVF